MSLHEIEEHMSTLEAMASQRSAVLATIVGILRKTDSYKTVAEFKEQLALGILHRMQEHPVADFIDGKVAVDLTEMVDGAVEGMDEGTRKAFKQLKNMIEKAEAEVITDLLKKGLGFDTMGEA